MKKYQIRMDDNCMSEHEVEGPLDLVLKVNKFLRDFCYHEDQILDIREVGPQDNLLMEEQTRNASLVMFAREFFNKGNKTG
jgi:hypothetical protein|tara:strand:+ start:197 stop:439 length:243 start_codon:yes stop_codon:yes gene_type:complete